MFNLLVYPERHSPFDPTGFILSGIPVYYLTQRQAGARFLDTVKLRFSSNDESATFSPYLLIGDK